MSKRPNRKKDRTHKRRKIKSNEPRRAHSVGNGIIFIEATEDSESEAREATVAEERSLHHRATITVQQSNRAMTTLTRMVQNIDPRCKSTKDSLKAREALKELDRLVNKASQLGAEAAKVCRSLDDGLGELDARVANGTITAKLEHTENQMENLLNTINLLEVMEAS